MKPVTRRFGLGVMAGAAAASMLNGSSGVAAAPADPALDAIARHRQAAAEHLASIYATDDTDRGTDARWDAEEHQEACCHRERDAAWELATTIPMTLAGVAAVLEYVNKLEATGEEWPDSDVIGPEGWHYKLRETMAAAVVNLGTP
ncbi:hypothetical protein E3H11_11975 [Bradyrhizobium brasilense]|uniref:hypothetical protein n=1 Tax=Bradyrhizobium brasilense TaxID=1419277 RepID=UPI0014563285|nr:hypothetical protein [Bradyrhizobium brasilense]NLS69620.1 hypothetical protein [Bradyrhizobium brasilense]